MMKRRCQRRSHRAGRRREVTRKAARAAKAVVVPVDDDYDGLVNGEATSPPSKAAPEAPAEKVEDEEANKEG
jgi:hypothetical protein